MNKVNAKWALRLLKSDSFVVLTDKASVMYLDVKDPRDIHSVFILMGQKAALSKFDKQLHTIMNDHDKAMRRLRSKHANSKATKVNPKKR